MIQHFILEGQHLGTAPRTLLMADRGYYAKPLSKLFYCGECGTVYAQCPILQSSGKVLRWHSVHGLCRRCLPYDLRVPGSIWHHEAPFTEAFPPAVLQWELERQMEYQEKYRGKRMAVESSVQSSVVRYGSGNLTPSAGPLS